jgi:hypothetical protein
VGSSRQAPGCSSSRGWDGSRNGRTRSPAGPRRRRCGGRAASGPTSGPSRGPGRSAARAWRCRRPCGSRDRTAAGSGPGAVPGPGRWRCGSRRPSRPPASSGRRCARRPAAATPGASTARRSAPPATAAATTPSPRPARASVPATAARRPRDRRQRVQGDHVQRVVDQVEQLHRPAGVVHVVGVTVVAGVDGDDRLQRRRPLGRHQERVEPRVAGPIHPDRPGRPRPPGQPTDHLAQIGLLARRVLVGGHPLRGPRPPQVDPGHRVPVLAAQPLVLRPVGRGGVVLAVRQRLQHHRRRPPGLHRLGQEQAGRKPNPVLHRDPAPPLHHARILPAPNRPSNAPADSPGRQRT